MCRKGFESQELLTGFSKLQIGELGKRQMYCDIKSVAGEGENVLHRERISQEGKTVILTRDAMHITLRNRKQSFELCQMHTTDRTTYADQRQLADRSVHVPVRVFVQKTFVRPLFCFCHFLLERIHIMHVLSVSSNISTDVLHAFNGRQTSKTLDSVFISFCFLPLHRKVNRIVCVCLAD